MAEDQGEDEAMHITKGQLEILRVYQTGITKYQDIAKTLNISSANTVGERLYKLYAQNGIADSKWLLRHIHNYDLSTLRPTRERNLHTGRRVGIRQSPYGRWLVYIQRGGKRGKRKYLGSWLFRQDAIAARLAAEKKHFGIPA